MTARPVEPDTTRATARLLGLDIEIVHRRPSDDVEQLSINLRATPSFEVFGRFAEAANPFAFWARAVQLAWLPWLAWLEGARMMAPPQAAAIPLQPLLPGAAPAGNDDHA